MLDALHMPHSLVWPNKDHGMVGIARLPDGINDFVGKELKYKSLRNVQFNVFLRFLICRRVTENAMYCSSIAYPRR